MMKKFLFQRKPVFTVKQLDRLSNIFDNAGQGVLVVAVLSPLIAGIDKANALVIGLGLLIAFACWALSVWLARKGGNK